MRTGADGDRELVMARWGMPGPPQYGGAPVTNIRNVSSPHWRGWLGARNRCLVPAKSFCECADSKPRRTPIWFALSEDRPLFAFAGLWTPWHGVRGPKSAPIEGRHELFGFLTTEANAVVAPAEFDRWLEADTISALGLQRPLSNEALRIGIDQIASQPPEPRQGAVLVRAGEPAVADHVRNQDRTPSPIRSPSASSTTSPR